MSSGPLSGHIADLAAGIGWLLDFFTRSTYARSGHGPNACDFVAGNPQDLALPRLVDALKRWSEPLDKDWFAYKLSEPEATTVVAESLTRRRGVPFAPDDVFMTNGGFAAIAVALRTVVDRHDEVIFNSPPWFFYEPLVRGIGAVPVRVRIRPDTFDLDVDAIAAAITPRTRAVIINTPNNPTGRIYPPEVLAALAATLESASRRHDRAIYLLSDEPYSRILFDGRAFHTPAEFYPRTFVLYSYGKQLLAPGQRLGYVALPSSMPDRDALRAGIPVAQLAMGYAFPNALLQHALRDLEEVCIDLASLQRRRDRMVVALREMGYELHAPEATFYLLPRSPLQDDAAFTELLAARDVFVLPGRMVEMSGYLRISLTASDAMVERALPHFAAAIAEARAAGVAAGTTGV